MGLEAGVNSGRPVLVSVFNSAGKIMTQFEASGPSPVTVPTATWPGGLYHCRIITADSIEVRQIVINSK